MPDQTPAGGMARKLAAILSTDVVALRQLGWAPTDSEDTLIPPVPTETVRARPQKGGLWDTFISWFKSHTPMRPSSSKWTAMNGTRPS